MSISDDNNGIIPEEAPAKQAWLLTFGDLICLMLTFFVMLYSMQVVENNKWRSVLSSFTLRLNPNAVQSPIVSIPNKTEPIVVEQPASNLDYMKSVLLDKLSEYEQFDASQIRRLEDRLVMTFPEDALLQNLTFSEQSIAQIEALANVLNTITNRVEINGVAAKTPAAGTPEWHESLRIADAVIRELHRYGYTEPVAAFSVAPKTEGAGTPFELIIREVRTHE